MRWSEKLREQGTDMELALAEIRSKDWLSVSEAEILLDLPIKAGYRLLESGQWEGVAKRFGRGQWRISRQALEWQVPGGQSEIEDAGRGFVRLSKLTLKQLERRIAALEEENAGLQAQVKRKSLILRKLVEGIEDNDFALERAQ